MNIDQVGIDFIKANEGCVLREYLDSAGRRTIGVGHLLIKGEQYPNGITPVQANLMLVIDVETVERVLNTLIGPECNQNQFNALCDFGFNLGIGALKQMMSHGWAEIPLQIPRWNKERHGNDLVESLGLTARRQREVDLFSK